VPARQRASPSSLLRRLEAASARNRQLAQDNDRLRRQLARECKYNGVTSSDGGDTR
jgi:hypothetical protein